MQSSRVPQLKNFLFCCSLLTGSKVIGLLKAIIQLLFAITLFILYSVHLSSARVSFVGPIVVFICGLSFIEAYFAVILLHGLIKRKPAYVKIWVVVQFSILIQNLASLLILTIIAVISALVYQTNFDYKHILYVLGTINLYCTMVVYSYYRDEYYRDRSGNIITADLLDSLT